MKCKICAHERRSDIELSILNMSETLDIDAISQEYEVPVEDLKMHALMHTPVHANSSDLDTLAKQIKLREAELLSRTAHDYLITMTSIGRRIRHFSDADEVALSRLLSKAVVDLYLGCGAEIRHSVNALSDLNSKINGDSGATSGLTALANALSASREQK